MEKGRPVEEEAGVLAQMEEELSMEQEMGDVAQTKEDAAATSSNSSTTRWLEKDAVGGRVNVVAILQMLSKLGRLHFLLVVLGARIHLPAACARRHRRCVAFVMKHSCARAARVVRSALFGLRRGGSLSGRHAVGTVSRALFQFFHFVAVFHIL